MDKTYPVTTLRLIRCSPECEVVANCIETLGTLLTLCDICMNMFAWDDLSSHILGNCTHSSLKDIFQVRRFSKKFKADVKMDLYHLCCLSFVQSLE